MHMNIYKTVLLDVPGTAVVSLPFEDVQEAKNNILSIQAQYGNTPTVWYLDFEKTQKDFLLVCLPTGPNVFCNYVSKADYIGTAFIEEGMLVFHYFLTELPTD